jgi:hypothetical protein
MSVVRRLKWNNNVYYVLWVGRIVHELYDFLTDDDEYHSLLLLQLFFKSLCRFFFGGEASMKLVLFEKNIWGRNAAMNFISGQIRNTHLQLASLLVQRCGKK